MAAKFWLKDGKLVVDGYGKPILCETCPCEECCPFAWPNPGSGHEPYPETDLPDSVVATVCGEPITLTRSGYNFYGSGSIFVALESTDGPYWLLFYDGTLCQFGRPTCLIGSYPIVVNDDPEVCCTDPVIVTDLFSDTYTVDGDTITRQTPCTWTGAKTGGGTWTLRYDSAAYKWHLSSTRGSPTSDYKTAPQSSPAGTYGTHTVT
jgi:hypothetical protein